MSSPKAFKEDNASFEDFLKQSPTTIEYRLVVKNSTGGKIEFYIHPFNRNGKSLDFEVKENKIRCITENAID